ncbi:hypothetical protein [Pseudofrankia asymbiotica]|uniref:hypothetical protein n=1 Tax=Pseudofrankia asymbiotica TaxID=1834516 RepID=UPI0010558C0C|nr:hypothetical protein [Pseudofrankia asymbiotica]
MSVADDLHTQIYGGSDSLGDVRVTGCIVDEEGNISGTVAVTNRTDQAAAFTVVVAFTGPDGVQVATGSTFMPRLDPGQTARKQVVSFASSMASMSVVDCQVLSAQRTTVP